MLAQYARHVNFSLRLLASVNRESNVREQGLHRLSIAEEYRRILTCTSDGNRRRKVAGR